ncbi:MAG: aminodeoxychorismate synthase component I [Gammaproteobacteria bacterium]|nr:aminodeoxychorismate synthase component I [Gammaproteobacteria bacterium]
MLSTQSQKIDLLEFHDLNPDRYPFLLESVANGTDQSRYDILFACPQETLRLTSDGKLHGTEYVNEDGFLSSFDAWFKAECIQTDNESSLPFTGGWFVFLAYELITEIETNLELPIAEEVETVAYAVRCPAAIIIDHDNNTTNLFSEDHYSELMPDLLADYNQLCENNKCSEIEEVNLLGIKEEPGEQYCQAVDTIRDYIIEGDVFQVNLSRQWVADIDEKVSATDLYANLRINNSAPFSGLVCLPDATIISSSPERLVYVHNHEIESRPIAGTRPRSTNAEEDSRLSAELLSHPKEQAEHIMLIDLERNDLGRVCIPGTIYVDELMTLESYAHVHHIVSNIKGKLRENVTPSDIIRAVFPGGTITGCPKVRCMEIIAELEKTPRGVYTGSIGYINLDGSMDLNILIRTLQMQDHKITFRTGAGIVYDSDAENELNETRDKARGLLRALSINDA